MGLLVGTYLLDASEGAPTPTAALPRALCHDSNPPCVPARVRAGYAARLSAALLGGSAQRARRGGYSVTGLRHSSCRAPRAPAALRPTYARSRAVPREASPAAAAATLACRHPRLPPPPLAATIRQRSFNGSRHPRLPPPPPSSSAASRRRAAAAVGAAAASRAASASGAAAASRAASASRAAAACRAAAAFFAADHERGRDCKLLI